jgi:hypothetical protein
MRRNAGVHAFARNTVQVPGIWLFFGTKSNKKTTSFLKANARDCVIPLGTYLTVLYTVKHNGMVNNRTCL